MTALLFLATVTNWDDANWVSAGGAGAFAPHKTIHMLGEDVSIEVGDDRIHVRAVFSFENRGAATTVKMAFPFSTAGWNEDLVRSFATKVDGQVAKVEKLLNVAMRPEEKASLEKKFARSVVYVKTVEFAKGQRRTVLVDYVTGRGLAGNGAMADSYVFSSGATWAGKIGSITVTADWSRCKRVSRPDLIFWRDGGKRFPVAWEHLDHTRATCSIPDVEPDFDLGLDSIPAHWDVLLDGERVPCWSGWLDEEPCLSGDMADPLCKIEGIGKVIGDWAQAHGLKAEKSYVFPQFVSSFEDDKTLVMTNGKKLVLKRPICDEDGKPSQLLSTSMYVRFRDVIAAFGGSYSWNPATEQIAIKLPK